MILEVHADLMPTQSEMQKNDIVHPSPPVKGNEATAHKKEFDWADDANVIKSGRPHTACVVGYVSLWRKYTRDLHLSIPNFAEHSHLPARTTSIWIGVVPPFPSSVPH